MNAENSYALAVQLPGQSPRTFRFNCPNRNSKFKSWPASTCRHQETESPLSCIWFSCLTPVQRCNLTSRKPTNKMKPPQ